MRAAVVVAAPPLLVAAFLWGWWLEGRRLAMEPFTDWDAQPSLLPARAAVAS